MTCRQIVLCLSLAAGSLTHPVNSATVEAPLVQQPARAFGYSIGDVLQQRVSLDNNNDSSLSHHPKLQREGLWLERLSSTLSDDGRWLELRYQVINSPTQTMVVALPALELPMTDNSTLSIDSWPFSISPIAPAESGTPDGMPLLQPDRQPTTPGSAHVQRRLRNTVLTLLAALSTWLLWWLWQNRSDARRLPFAHAYHVLHKKSTQLTDSQPDTWRIMHHAFNQTAGRTVSTGTLTELLKETPWLLPQEQSIREFYASSTRHFFAETEQFEADFLQLSNLSKALYQAEKRHVSAVKLSRRQPPFVS